MEEHVQPAWDRAMQPQPLAGEAVAETARAVLAQMTLKEKVGQMSGDTPLVPGLLRMARAYGTAPYPAGENRRLGIPAIRFSDGPRGVTVPGSTCFPVPMARGASWDVELEERIGAAMGVEARAQGANLLGAVCINLLRHPAWGRAQETYGEDPYHLGELGAALVRGIQRHVMACVKHYAGNSIENTRFKVDVKIDERSLREVYLPHFKRCVEAGAAAVMSAYNRVNGQFCSQNDHLLSEILKQEWGFDGFVLSDFVFGVHDGEAAALAGLDLEMPFTRHYGRRLERLVHSGRVPPAIVDAAVLRILKQKIRFQQKPLFAGAGEAGRYAKETVCCEAHRALARQAAEASAVLLKNDPLGAGEPLLPVDPARVRRIAVLGRLADTPNTGDAGSSQARPPYVVTPLAGLRQAAPEMEIRTAPAGDLNAAAAAARAADLAVVIAGLSQAEEGEYMPGYPPFFQQKGGDRLSLDLPAQDQALILQAAAANPRTVVVLVGGSAVVMERWRAQVPAILVLWYPGMEGGHALGNLLFGRSNPSGKLPCVFPQSAGQLPPFDPQSDEVEYGYYHGYRLMDKSGAQPAFAFGYGLSYTRFRTGPPLLERDAIHPGEALKLGVEVENCGGRAGAEVVQLYTGCEDSAYDRPVKELKGFQKIFLQPGERRRVELTLPTASLAVYDHGWRVEPGAYRLWVGTSSRAEDLQAGGFRVI